MKYVIIGNSAAAVGAVEGIRRLDSENPITIIAEEPQHTYARPLISYLLSGKVTKENMFYRPLDFYDKNHVIPMLGCRAVSIDTGNKHVVRADGSFIGYDKLLIATGSRSSFLRLPGNDYPNVFSFYTWADSERLCAVLKPGMRAVVIGAGLTALKAAEALVNAGIETTLVVRSRILRTLLDERASELLLTHLQDNGLQLVMGCEPQQILGKEKAEAVKLTNGQLLPCDIIISAVGITANTELACKTQIAVGKGVIVNEFMETTEPEIYAAGDVAQGPDSLTGEHRVIPLLPVAYVQGETAGQNMAGGKVSYQAVAMNAVTFFGLSLISAGLLQDNAGDDCAVIAEPERKMYRKLVFKGDCLVGFILVNEVDRAGMLTWLIREKIDISSFKESLVDATFNYAHLPRTLRIKQLVSAGSTYKFGL